MRLRSFTVRGYKNIVQTVVLTELAAINVFHGPNNVGKSNLLEAMDLFFELLGFEQEGWLPIAAERRVTEEELVKRDFPPREIFNLGSPVPIEMEAEIETDAEELGRSGIRPLIDARRVRIQMSLSWDGVGASYRVLRFQFADGTDAAAQQGSADRKAWVLRFTRYLTANFLVHDGESDRFVRIHTDRLSARDLALKLYDAKESPDLELARRWERFVEAMSAFQDILGQGTFIVTYDRRANRAGLFYETSLARIPLHLLGSGVQQIVALLGRLLVNTATLVAIEEPELNLRYPLQERLREVLARLVVGGAGGPSQLFITSHSPAFETDSKFYWMTPSGQGPVVEARGRAEAALALELPTAEALQAPVPEGAARCYLSSEGVVRVPDVIRDALGLPQGGGVMFVPDVDRVEMLSDEQFLRKIGKGDDDA